MFNTIANIINQKYQIRVLFLIFFNSLVQKWHSFSSTIELPTDEKDYSNDTNTQFWSFLIIYLLAVASFSYLIIFGINSILLPATHRDSQGDKAYCYNLWMYICELNYVMYVLDSNLLPWPYKNKIVT